MSACTTMKLTRRAALGRALGIAALGIRGGLAVSGQRKSLNNTLTGYLPGLHDPVIIREGDTYHLFGSGAWTGKPGPTWRTSKDLAMGKDQAAPFETKPRWHA